MSNNCIVVPIIIPSYEPDDRMLDLLKSLSGFLLKKGKDPARKIAVPIVIVDDGSGEECWKIFETARKKYQCIVIRHFVNLGKGRGLKDAFNYCLCRYPDMLGCVTADSDGQHTAEDIFKCIDALTEFPQSFILGVRTFDGEMVPAKSRLGNKLTKYVCKYLCGVDVSDTQTGLRAIPRDYMAFLLNVKGERFEFETQMLIESREKIKIHEIPIQTVYESKKNHKTHFHPVIDSIRIYSIFCAVFIKFLLSSFSSCLLDIFLFHMLLKMLPEWSAAILISTVIARIISASYNYFINSIAVFRSRKKTNASAERYVVLAAGIMLSSAFFVTLGVKMFPHIPETALKIVVDCMLFLISYTVQREFVFIEREKI